MTRDPIVAVAYDLDAFQAFLKNRTTIGPLVLDEHPDNEDRDVIFFAVETNAGLVQLRIDLAPDHTPDPDEPRSQYELRIKAARQNAIEAVADRMGQPVYRGYFSREIERY